MKITVKYFASIREAIGQGSELRDTSEHAGRCAMSCWQPHPRTLQRSRAASRCAWRSARSRATNPLLALN
jgi:hypothetical protein